MKIKLTNRQILLLIDNKLPVTMSGNTAIRFGKYLENNNIKLKNRTKF